MAYSPNNPNGSASSANSAPVVIASDQAAVLIEQNDVNATGSITTQNLNPNSGTATAASTIALSGPVSGLSTASIQVTGTYTGALTPQVSIDGANWITMSATALVNTNTNVYSATIPSAAKQIYQTDIAGFPYFRISALAAVTGTAVVTIRGTNATGLIGIDNPLPTGANVVGAVTQSGTWTVGTKTAGVYVGQKFVSTTAVQISATSNVPTNGILVKALSTNTAPIFVGSIGVNTSTGWELVPGESAPFTANLNTIYIVSAASTTDKVCFNVN